MYNIFCYNYKYRVGVLMNNFKNKELYTIESCQQLEALEAVISNPEMPIKDILERSDCYYNPQHVDLIIALSHFLMNKDQAIKKSKNGFENWLIDAYTQLYTVETSPLGIVDFVEGMNAVRNNIGHGKYEIDPETLNVKIARPSLVVEYDWLRPLIDTYFVDNKKKTKELPLKTGFIRKTSNDEIDINDIEKIGEMYNVNEFNIDAKSKDFNSNSLLYIQSGINYLCTISSEEDFKNQVKNCQDVANLSNLTFDHKSYKMGDDLKKKLGETIENNYERLNRTNQEGLNTFMEGFMNDFYFDNTDVLMLDKAYSQIEKVARNINRATSENYNQLKQLIKGLPPTDNQMMLATILTKFNAIFGYNEDEIFKTYLDYSKLPMDNMQPTVCTDNAERAYNTQTNKIMALEKNVEKNYKGYLSKMQIPNKPEKLIANISNTSIDIYKGLFDILEQKEQIHEIR